MVVSEGVKIRKMYLKGKCVGHIIIDVTLERSDIRSHFRLSSSSFRRRQVTSSFMLSFSLLHLTFAIFEFLLLSN